MSDALSLPPRPNLEQYRKLAKDFQHACQSSDPDAIHRWATRWMKTLARSQGRGATPAVQNLITNEAEGIARRWLEFKQTQKRAARCLLTDAQFFLAREHGFANWPKFARHLTALTAADSPVTTFETAADAIVSGDLATLEKLLKENPSLVKARSTREHRSTLLHYVSANGVEDFRQKTPKNILEITKLLLQAGADVNAESDAYGGRSTTLGLAATSWHPEKAGVQLPLMVLLIAHGAIINGADGGSGVNGCLHNGRGQAAEFLASRGARLDLEGAAGVGRLDVVKSFFDKDGSLKTTVPQQQLLDGFAWACEFGRNSVVDFLLPRYVGVDTKLNHHGQTGLHLAAIGGHADTVKLLLEHGSPVDRKDESFNGTPLEWALYGWGEEASANKRDRDYYEVVALLARAGATLDSHWYEDDENRGRATKKMRSDPRMRAALRGEFPAE